MKIKKTTEEEKIKLKKRKERKANSGIVKSTIRRMRNSGKTLQRIGDAVGLTRERVRQLEVQMGFPKRPLQRATRIQKPCKNPNCKNVMVLLISGSKRKFCSRECQRGSTVKKTIEEKRAIWNKRTKDYYHNVLKKRPDFKDLVKARNDKYYKNLNKTNAKRRAK